MVNDIMKNFERKPEDSDVFRSESWEESKECAMFIIDYPESVKTLYKKVRNQEVLVKDLDITSRGFGSRQVSKAKARGKALPQPASSSTGHVPKYPSDFQCTKIYNACIHMCILINSMNVMHVTATPDHDNGFYTDCACSAVQVSSSSMQYQWFTLGGLYWILVHLVALLAMGAFALRGFHRCLRFYHYVTRVENRIALETRSRGTQTVFIPDYNHVTLAALRAEAQRLGCSSVGSKTVLYDRVLAEIFRQME